MSVIGIDHVQLAMPAGREDEARRFYRDILGIPERPKPEDMKQRGGCWFESGAVKVHVGVDADFRAAGKAHPGLLVDDLGVIAARCRAGGFVTTPAPAIEGYDHFYVNDPFGNRLEILQKT